MHGQKNIKKYLKNIGFVSFTHTVPVLTAKTLIKVKC